MTGLTLRIGTFWGFVWGGLGQVWKDYGVMMHDFVPFVDYRVWMEYII